MKKIVLIFFIIINISCNNKNLSEKVDNNHMVSDKEIYTFLYVVLEKQPKSINKCNNEDVLDFIEHNNELKKMFSVKDLAFINKQIENEEKFEINSEYLTNYNIISEKTIDKKFSDSKNMISFWEEFEKEYGTQSYFSLSLPIFSLDKKTVIICTEVLHKGGFGASGTQVYRKINGKWKLYKNYSSSIS